MCDKDGNPGPKLQKIIECGHVGLGVEGVNCSYCKKSLGKAPPARKVQAHLSRNREMAKESSVSVCTHAPDSVAAQMVAEIQAAAKKKAVKKQRTLQATLEVREVQSTARQLTLEQSSKRKASSELDTAIADLVHAERLPHGFPRAKRFKLVLELAAKAGPNYIPPNSEQVAGILLDSLAAAYEEKALKRVNHFADEFGVAIVSDGATIHHTPLMNVLATTNGAVELLSIVSAEGYLASGGTKDSVFVANECMESCKKLEGGEKNVYLYIFDGASNMHNAGEILSIRHPQAGAVHCALHVTHLMLGAIAELPAVNELITAYSTLRHHFTVIHAHHDIFLKYCVQHEKKKLSFPIASDTRMGIHFICLHRLLRLKNTLRSCVSSPEYIALNLKSDPALEIINDNTFFSNVAEVVGLTFPLLKLLRVGDTNAPVMGSLYQSACETEHLVSTRLQKPESPFLQLLADNVPDILDRYMPELKHEYALVGFLLEPRNRVEAKQRITGAASSDFMEAFTLVAKRILFSGVPFGEQDERVEEAQTALFDFLNQRGCWARPVAWKAASHREGHLWHEVHSLGCPMIRKLGMVVLSKPVGCGAPERNWADVKNVWTKAKATMTEERVEKKTRIYSSARRDPDLNEDVMDKPHIYTFWTKEDEEFDLKLKEHLVLPDESPLVSRHFNNYVEGFEQLEGLRKNSKVVRERLLKKYKGIRFFDAEEDETYVIVDVEYTKTVRPAQHAAVCILYSATGEEAEEPDTQPYLINEALHDMIRETAEQDPGVVLLEKSTTEEEEA